jgi:hypothetical protein
MANAAEEKDKPNFLTVIQGRQLSAVVFVQDYVQLQFDGPGLSAYTLPVVVFGERHLEPGSPGYRDGLCGQITKRVRRAYLEEGRRFQIDFEDGSAIVISLRTEDRHGPEAIWFHSGRGKEWGVC